MSENKSSSVNMFVDITFQIEIKPWFMCLYKHAVSDIVAILRLSSVGLAVVSFTFGPQIIQILVVT